jgi:ATP-dependent helicase/nuclease subunit A
LSKRFDCTATAGLRQRAQAAAMAEYQRLLYVALTRARYRLVLTAHASPKDGSWYATVERALDDVLEPVCDDAGHVVARRWVMGAGDGGVEPLPAAPPETSVLPLWIERPPRRESRDRLNPSTFGNPLGGEALTAGSGKPGRKRGVYVHRLLDALAAAPLAERRRIGARWLDGEGVQDVERDAILAECLAVLEHPGLGALFGPGSIAEAAMTGWVAHAGKDYLATGRADRLAVGADTVFIVDFKSDASPPAPGAPLPPKYVAQLALYRRLLSAIYPEKRLRAGIVWTAAPRLDELDDETLETALAAALTAKA